MEAIVISLFCMVLILCICLQQSVIIALLVGLVLFSIYAYKKGFRINEILQMYSQGIVTSKNVIMAMALIGMLTALWRASGTIATIICYSSGFFIPAVFLMVTFLLNCLVSFLTGSSFCTAATIGVICATIAATMGIPMYIIGGAILSGAYWGDRCSPVSTSALLVSEITKTNIYDNIRRMMRSSLVPSLIAVLFYLGVGFVLPKQMEAIDVRGLFQAEFAIHPLALVPTAVILVLAIMRVNIKISLLIDIVVSAVVCKILQGTTLIQICRIIICGFEPKTSAISGMISGGGIVSMLKVIAIITLASAYSGIFQKTGLLNFIEKRVQSFAKKHSVFASGTLVSILTGMIACNQTLTIILTHQICKDLYDDDSVMANDLEDNAVVIAPLIPWSIAGAVPLATVGAPTSGLVFAVYLFILPMWRMVSGKIM